MAAHNPEEELPYIVRRFSDLESYVELCSLKAELPKLTTTYLSPEEKSAIQWRALIFNIEVFNPEVSRDIDRVLVEFETLKPKVMVFHHYHNELNLGYHLRSGILPLHLLILLKYLIDQQTLNIIIDGYECRYWRGKEIATLSSFLEIYRNVRNYALQLQKLSGKKASDYFNAIDCSLGKFPVLSFIAETNPDYLINNLEFFDSNFVYEILEKSLPRASERCIRALLERSSIGMRRKLVNAAVKIGINFFLNIIDVDCEIKERFLGECIEKQNASTFKLAFTKFLRPEDCDIDDYIYGLGHVLKDIECQAHSPLCGLGKNILKTNSVMFDCLLDVFFCENPGTMGRLIDYLYLSVPKIQMFVAWYCKRQRTENIDPMLAYVFSTNKKTSLNLLLPLTKDNGKQAALNALSLSMQPPVFDYDEESEAKKIRNGLPKTRKIIERVRELKITFQDAELIEVLRNVPIKYAGRFLKLWGDPVFTTYAVNKLGIARLLRMT